MRERGSPLARAEIFNMKLANILRQFIDMRVITIFFTSQGRLNLGYIPQISLLNFLELTEKSFVGDSVD